MADFFEELTEAHVTMIAAQPVFFVATAAEGARINLSPKGYDCFKVLSPKRVAYLDLGGLYADLWRRQSGGFLSVGDAGYAVYRPRAQDAAE